MEIPTFWETMIERRTCKEFTNEPVDFDKIAQVIEAGMYAPSSGNLQNWKFILLTEKNSIRDLYKHTLKQDVFNTAPFAIIVCSDDKEAEKYYGMRGKKLYSLQNAGACIQNMLLAATVLQLGSAWIGAFDEDIVRRKFSIPDNVRPQAIILIGKEAKKAKAKTRKKINEVTYFNNYGNKLQHPHRMFRDYSLEWQQQSQQFHEMQQQIRTKVASKETLSNARAQTRKAYEKTKKRLDDTLTFLKDENKKRKKS